MTNKPLNDYLQTLDTINKMENNIFNSDEYIDLKEEIGILTDKLQAMQDPISGLKTKAEALKKEILKSEEIDPEIGEIKYRTKKEVSTAKLLDVIGDPGTVLELATVTQTKLKEYAKDNPDLKKPLMGCVKEVSKTPSDIIIF